MHGIFKKYLRVIKFGVVGCINTAVDFISFCIADMVFVLEPEVSQAVGYSMGVVCSFLLNRAVTFADAKKQTIRGETARAVRFATVNALSFAVSVGAMAYFTDGGMWEYLAKLIVTAITMVINYLGYKVFVFKIREG